MLSHRERKPIGAILRAIIVVSCGLFLLAAISAFWRRRASPAPSATVRKVILHQPNQHDGPVIYMDDGTVWVLSDAPERICITRGDRIRYVSEPNIPRQQNSASPDTCKLEDSSTGYVAEAVRLSAPFTHSSCPGN
jgi:hypothetical protein